MMRLLCCLFLFILICPPHIRAQKKEYHILSVGFYNLENLFDTEDDPENPGDNEFLPNGSNRYTNAIYNQKLHNLATVISRLGEPHTPQGPAILGVSEIENRRVLEDLIRQPSLKDRDYGIIHFESPDHRGIDVGMLYLPAYFTPLDARPVYVNISSLREGHTTRDILYVTGILSGDTVHVFVNHWPSRSGGEHVSAPLRKLAARTCRSVIDSILARNSSSHIIVMGDLNDDPVNASVVHELKSGNNISKLKGNSLYNPWYPLYKKGMGTLGYNDSWNLFDQIIISRSWLGKERGGWKFYKAEIFNRDFLTNSFGKYKGYPHRSFSRGRWINGYSDHFPVLVYMIRPV